VLRRFGSFRFESVYALFVAISVAILSLNLPHSMAHAQGSAFETPAPHAVIIDHATGLVLYEKDARAPVAPASMTKIITANMVFEKLRDGTLSPDTLFTVSEEAWRRGGAKSGSSTMFLSPGSTVSVEDLLRGVIIQSGNDACIVLAENIAGSETAFADQMTRRAAALGMDTALFRNATGWPDPEHRISTYDLAQLARHTIEKFPEFYAIYNERDFTWNNITQGNRNPLLGRFTGADGLKTGHTQVSGYGLVASAERAGIRRTVVVNGLSSKAQRRDESLRLMQAAFDQFKVYDLYTPGETVGSVDVYMGQTETVSVITDSAVRSGLYRGDRAKLKTQLRYVPAAAPITKGDQIAELIIYEPGQVERIVPLYASNDVKAKSIFGRAWAVLIDKIRG